jgi:hypothetical protein
MSFFVDECWRLVGSDAFNPRELDNKFKELERLRNEVGKWDQERLALTNEISAWELKVAQLKTEVQYLRETAKASKELSASNQAASEELRSFREREELHIRPMLTAFAAYLQSPEDPNTESALSLIGRLSKVRAYKVSPNVRNDTVVRALEELEKLRLESARQKEDLAEAREVLQTRELAKLEFDLVKAANQELAKAFRSWENATKGPEAV